MRRAERLFRLTRLMREARLSRGGDLAAALEVSVRTVYRDIAHLQASGVPIDGAAGVGYLLRPGFDLPPLTFTYEQIEALALGVAYVSNVGDPDLAAAAREAMAKIEAALPADRRTALRQAPYFAVRRGGQAQAIVKTIRDAIRECRILDLTYEDRTGARSLRRIRPLALTSFTDGWMVGAWCELRRDLRDFRLDRILALETTADTFTPSPGADLAAYRARHDEVRAGT